MNNKQISLAARPHGEPQQSDWQLLETPVEVIKDQQIVVKVEYISLDPAMRGWINEGRSYIEPVELGAVMRSYIAGQITESTNSDFAVGDYVRGIGRIEQYYVGSADGFCWAGTDDNG